MKKTITLQILKKDIETSRYTDPHDCALARAIKRLNNPSVEYNVDSIFIVDKIIDIGDLENRVISMYKFLNPKEYDETYISEEPKDFEYIVEYEE